MPVNYDHFLINGFWTRTAICGDFHPTEEHSEDSDVVLIIVIPGNPGICDFYEEFIEVVFKQLKSSVFENDRIAIWVPSHAAHCKLPDEIETQSSTDIPLLNDQIEHKVEFIRRHVPRQNNIKLFLVGHSIGSYIILNMLDRLKDEGLKIEKSILLFPTIERMGEAPAGRPFVLMNHRPIFKTLLRCLMYLACNVVFYSGYIRDTYLRYHIGNASASTAKGAQHMFHYQVARASSDMAFDEMHKVTELNANILDRHLSSLILYYGQKDHWVPVDYYDQLCSKFSTAEALLCEDGIEHAFVMYSADKMASRVVQWIMNLL